MNFPNILIQCSLNQMIIIKMTLDIILFYINYQQRKHRVVVYKTLYTKALECIIEKLVTHPYNDFQIIWKITIFRILMKIIW